MHSMHTDSVIQLPHKQKSSSSKRGSKGGMRREEAFQLLSARLNGSWLKSICMQSKRARAALQMPKGSQIPELELKPES